MKDIRRFREEFKTLIERLSGTFLRWKKAEKAEQKKLKTALAEKSTECLMPEQKSLSSNREVETEERTTIEGCEKENRILGSLDRNAAEAADEKTKNGTSETECPAKKSIVTQSHPASSKEKTAQGDDAVASNSAMEADSEMEQMGMDLTDDPDGGKPAQSTKAAQYEEILI
jgi:hypothetical protein